MEDLIMRHLRRETSPEERKMLFSWIASDPKNELLYMNYKKAFAFTSTVENIDAEVAWRKIGWRTYRRQRVMKLGISLLKYAAILILAFMLFRQLDDPGRSGTTEMHHSVTAEDNQINHVLLSDGSGIWLNANSKLEIPSDFSEDHRIVRLSGQGYFEIMHRDQSPFIVTTGHEQIRVLGTRFNINAYHPDYLEVTLVEGKVQFLSGDQYITEMVPGEKLLYDYSSGSVEREWLDNTDFYSSWKTGRLHFENIPLRSIIEMLEKWYPVRFKLASPGIGDIRFTGTLLKREELDQALKLFRSSSDLDFRKYRSEDMLLIEFYQP